ncbi:RecA-superfamily ATPase possibly involved in signal transduction [Caldisphaera lagunensis DSM 15908]|uniref:RecA-superfamily ATPase possibly involved in signal transduction n=1 Tax=Caldisphaera lagunensis (strain DSM 15908 / JCM 11604 / ANMR 0165 / IC-154) TaxID=1056495 RepID=L0AAL5_CALLD|nr:ATPase domain-containing protein [Caldisphaera lagunensis]AFZ70080.1 RecA-superfamily ATPase possibly involved in signal transduction [Caldisphaera lagunensis DSM 15908]
MQEYQGNSTTSLSNFIGPIKKGNVILIVGNPGAGKTIIASKLSLDEIVNNGGSVLYLNMSEVKKDYFKNLKILGVDFEKLENENKFYYIEGITLVNKDSVYELLNQILSYSEKYNVSMVVIDSVTPIFQAFGNEVEVRELIHNFFYRLSKLSNKTLILTEEIPYGEEKFGYGVEEFIVDVIIQLKVLNVKGRIVRVMEIKKFRGSDISIGDIPFRIKSGELISLLYFKTHNQKSSDTIYKVGLGDATFAFYKGTQNLIMVDPKIDREGLIFLGIYGALLGNPFLQSGKEKTIIRVISSDIDKFKKKLNECLNSMSLGKDVIENIMNNIYVLGMDLDIFSLNDYFDVINEQEENIKPAIIIDLTLDLAYNLLGDQQLFNMLQLNLINKRSSNSITGLYIVNGKYKDIYSFPLVSLYDNIAYVKHYKNSGILVKPVKMEYRLFTLESFVINKEMVGKCEL